MTRTPSWKECLLLRANTLLITVGITLLAACGTADVTQTPAPPPSPTPPPPFQYPRPVGSVVVSGAPSPVVFVGETAALSAQVRDFAGGVLTGRLVTWTVAGTATVTVSAAGVITAFSPGDATVTATCEDQAGQLTVVVGYGDSLGTGGGIVQYPGHVSLAIGPSALKVGQRVAIVPENAPTPQSNRSLLTVLPRSFVLLYPRDLSLAGVSATLTLSYDPIVVPAGVKAASLVIVQYTGGAFTLIRPTAIDTVAHTVTTTQATGLFGYGIGY